MTFEKDETRPVENGDRTDAQTSPLEDLDTLQRELRELIHDQLQLAGLEVRLATHSLLAMIAAAICIGALLVLAWAGLMAATGLGLIAIGLQPAIALLVLTVLTVGLAFLLRSYKFRRSRRLGFPATLRSLMPHASKRIKAETT